MALNPDAVGSTSDPVDVSWDSRDALLYAVGIGAGHEELAFTTENTNGIDQLVFPTFPVVVGWGAGSAMGKVGSFDPTQLVHGKQAVTIHQPIPVEGAVALTGEITGMESGVRSIQPAHKPPTPTPLSAGYTDFSLASAGPATAGLGRGANTR